MDSSATTREIKKQYNKLAIAWHPDKNPGCGEPCNEKFNKVKLTLDISNHSHRFIEHTRHLLILRSERTMMRSVIFN